MPRSARIDAPGAVQHVIARGIERREIFRDDHDRWDLVERLERLFPLWSGTCFGWAFMPNHVHLVVRTGALPLAWLMHRLQTGFAIRFNQRHERVGYLFQNRFRSRLVSDADDLRNLMRYVHLNPLRAGIVADLDALGRHPWTGHAALVGARRPFDFEDVGRMLEPFGSDPAVARRRLVEWMTLAAHVPGREAPTREAPPRVPPARPLPAAGSRASSRISFDDVIERVCRHFSTSTLELARGARGRTAKARAVIAYVGVVELRLPIVRVAERLGVSSQAIGRALERGARIASEEGPVIPREGG
jgi:REP element-mobilizing transposase RayT